MKSVGSYFRAIPVAAALILTLLPALSPADPGTSYCITPPFIIGSITPNLLLMIDNSASMYDLFYQDASNMYCANSTTTSCTAGTTCTGTAYCMASTTTTTATTTSPKPCTADSECTGSGDSCESTGFCKKETVTVSTVTYTPIACDGQSATFCGDTSKPGHVAGDTCNNKCNVTAQCYDATYVNSTTYNGYFTPTATYSYDFTNNKFTSVGSIPTSCTYSTGTPKYVCVNTSVSGTLETIKTDSTGFAASGNFLNWLTTSKFDLEKQILTGGKYDTTNQVLIAESRGCSGRKFIKAVPGVSLTFAIRGGTPGGISADQNQATEYGQTYIQIYTGIYNVSDCLSAANDWMNVTGTNPVNLGSFQNDTKGCVGAGNGVLNGTNVWNHILHDCYQGMSGGAQGYGTNLSSLEGECSAMYATLSPNHMTDPNAGYAVCSSALSYVDGSGNPQTGYLGSCWNGTNFTGPCDVTQMANYCILNVNSNPVADPSSTALSGSGQSAPGFILEQGLMNTNLVGSLAVKIGLATTPTGLINKYQSQLRIGAMSFQNNGSGSECGGTSLIPCAKACSLTTTRLCYVTGDCPSGESCGTLPKTDGGKIVAYVGAGFCSNAPATPCTVDSECSSGGGYCAASVGDHSTGLIKSVDDLQATSWTPYAEAFYNAIGYFARSNDYTVSPPTSRSDANFNSLPSPNSADSYDSNKNPSQIKCQRNNIMLITDGMSTADKNTASEGLAALYASLVPNTVGGTTSYGISGYDTTNSCPKYSGSRSISDLAWVAKNRNIKTLAATGTASTTAPTLSSEYITTYVVYSGPQISGQPGLCDPKTLMTNTATNGGTTLFTVTDPSTFYTQLDSAFSTVVAQTSAGTAASILSNSQGSGASLLQAVFYPKKQFGTTEIGWIGEMHDLWYYIDPFLQNSTIREDTPAPPASVATPNVLDLSQDLITRFYFDTTVNQTKVDRYRDTGGNGRVTTYVDTISADSVNSLWRAGNLLQSTLPANRTIYANTDATTFNTGGTPLTRTVFNSSAASVALLQPLMGTGVSTASIVDYIRGTDYPRSGYPSDPIYRNRTVSVGGTSGAWKLGDIVSSTPHMQTSIPLNSYGSDPRNGVYGILSYDRYLGSTNYVNRGMAYVGANDGMLHAFNLGNLVELHSNNTQKATITGTSLGGEVWAFVPKNALPYLKYLTDPGYCHLFYVDAPPFLVDASIKMSATAELASTTRDNDCSDTNYWLCESYTAYGSGTTLDLGNTTWRTILIGGMGLGGASKNSDDGCTTGAAGTCVKNPINGVGYSSYFALDVTTPNDPKILWEFTDPDLGYSTSGPAVLREGNTLKNGRWFVVFASGPTGPIDTASHQFLGTSNQSLKLFVLDLKTGELVRKIDLGDSTNTNTTVNLQLDNAFSGSLFNSSLDTERGRGRYGDFMDNALYFGYVQANSSPLTSSTTWTKGGVLRLQTKQLGDATNHGILPSTWVVSKVIDNIGPVTSAVAKLQGQDLWLFFGTGRYFYKTLGAIDDADSLQLLYGVKDPCYSKTGADQTGKLDEGCHDQITSALVNQTDGNHTVAASAPGWSISLDASDTNYKAERTITDPVAVDNSGLVYFTTFKPTADTCGFGGSSFLWAVYGPTGQAANLAALQGEAVLQVSTGSFEELQLSSAFNDENHRRSAPMLGVPPKNQGLSLMVRPKPVKKITQIQEK